jgi:putative redox protein
MSMAVQVDIAYEGSLQCTAKHGPSGQSFPTDAPLDNGGRGTAFSPTDLVGTAMGTCMMTIMGLYAQRQGLDLTGTRVRVLKEMVADPLRRIGALDVTITFPAGVVIPADQREKLERAAHTCPVERSLHPDVKVSVEFVYPE